MKESVIAFLAENHDGAIKNVSFSDVPVHVMKVLLDAFSWESDGKYDCDFIVQRTT
jgi:hypothetical protein